MNPKLKSDVVEFYDQVTSCAAYRLSQAVANPNHAIVHIPRVWRYLWHLYRVRRAVNKLESTS